MKLQNIVKNDQMPTRRLGKTGYQVGLFSLGGQGSLESHGDEENCVEIIQRAYELGVNYFDSAPAYDESELYYGKAMRDWRNEVFLATKTDERDRDKSLKQIEQSLKRLNTDYIDLLQIHHLDTIDEVNKVTSKNGALQALIEMKAQKVIRHIGITGHSSPDVLMEVMNRFDFDTVLCPVNVGDRAMKTSFVDSVVDKANQKDVGVVGMKVFAQGFVFHPQGVVTSWEPLAYALSHPVSTVIVGVDTIAQLEENISIAKSFQQMDQSMMNEIEKKTAPHRRRTCFFRREFGGYDSREKLSPPYIIDNYDIK